MGKNAETGLKVLGVGLSRTGTTSLNAALEILGYKSEHSSWRELMPLMIGRVDDFDYRCFDHVDALTDVPTALFYDEILTAYPECKAILTIRDSDSWFESMKKHDEAQRKLGWFDAKSMVLDSLGCIVESLSTIRRIAYGTHKMHELLLKKKYREHNNGVYRYFDNLGLLSLNKFNTAEDHLLVMDIVAGDGWEKLCPFLDVPIPDVLFPRLHSTEAVAAGDGMMGPVLVGKPQL